MGTDADNKQSGLAEELLHNKEKRPLDWERSHWEHFNFLDDNESCYKWDFGLRFPPTQRSLPF